jgi:hypothetical protein
VSSRPRRPIHRQTDYSRHVEYDALDSDYSFSDDEDIDLHSFMESPFVNEIRENLPLTGQSDRNSVENMSLSPANGFANNPLESLDVNQHALNQIDQDTREEDFQGQALMDESDDYSDNEDARVIIGDFHAHYDSTVLFQLIHLHTLFFIPPIKFYPNHSYLESLNNLKELPLTIIIPSKFPN